MLRRARSRCPQSRHARPPDLRSCRARTRCLLLRHAQPRCLPLHLRGTLSRCRCTGVVRPRRGTLSRCRCTASFGADTGAASCFGGSCDASTGAVAAAASTGSLSSRAGGVPPARRPSGSSAYPSHGDSADGVSGRDSLLTEGEPRVSPVPSFVHDALADPHWRRAMEEEYAALLANQTWDLVPRPSGCNVVTGKWIWIHKR